MFNNNYQNPKKLSHHTINGTNRYFPILNINKYGTAGGYSEHCRSMFLFFLVVLFYKIRDTVSQHIEGKGHE